jgi:hypothetical protein
MNALKAQVWVAMDLPEEIVSESEIANMKCFNKFP